MGEVPEHSHGFHMKRILLAAIAASVFTTAAVAATDDDVLTCAGITNDAKERLECFDAVAKLLVSRKISSPENYILQRFKKSLQSKDKE